MWESDNKCLLLKGHTVTSNKEHAYLYKLVYKRPNIGVEHVVLAAILIVNEVEIEVAELHSGKYRLTYLNRTA